VPPLRTCAHATHLRFELIEPATQLALVLLLSPGKNPPSRHGCQNHLSLSSATDLLAQRHAQRLGHWPTSSFPKPLFAGPSPVHLTQQLSHLALSLYLCCHSTTHQDKPALDRIFDASSTSSAILTPTSHRRVLCSALFTHSSSNSFSGVPTATPPRSHQVGGPQQQAIFLLPTAFGPYLLGL
jgi:hypothetical protein